MPVVWPLLIVGGAEGFGFAELDALPCPWPL